VTQKSYLNGLKGRNSKKEFPLYIALLFNLVATEMFLEFLLVDILALLLTLRVALNVGSNASARILAANGGTEFPICFRTSVIEPTNSNSSG
jgi:hypothetical protein